MQLFLTIIRSFNTWFNKQVTQIHTHQLEGVISNKTLKILSTDLKEIYISFKEELPNEPNLRNEGKFDNF